MKPAELIVQDVLSREGYHAARHGYSILVYDDKIEAFIHVHNMYRLITVKLYRFGDRSSQERIVRLVEEALPGYRVEVGEAPPCS